MAEQQTSLAAALGFSANDLAANRQGMLSEAQQTRLQSSWRRQLIGTVIVVVAIMFGATLVLFFGQRSESAALSFIGVSLTVINAVIVGLGAQSYLRMKGDTSRGGVLVTSGVITHTIRVVSGRVTTFVLKIDGADEVIVSKPIFNAFAEGKSYTLYRTPVSKVLLSAE